MKMTVKIMMRKRDLIVYSEKRKKRVKVKKVFHGLLKVQERILMKIRL